MWCIPPEQNASFVCQMEQVLEVYQRPYDPLRPVVCMDEQPKQLISEVRPPIPVAPGRPSRTDHEYVRHGSCNVWMFVEPLGCWRDVRVTDRKTKTDWAIQMKKLIDHRRFATAEKITIICDNLNTHALDSFYEAFTPQEALRLIHRIEMIHTPKHGSWLNMAEPELSVLTRQCLSDRIDKKTTVQSRSKKWARERNKKQNGIDWQFTNEKARTKLKHLYPKIQL